MNGTKTGRFQSKESNIQSLPRTMDEENIARKAIILWEQDDNHPIHHETDTIEEMKEYIWNMFINGNSWCEMLVTTKEEYYKRLEDVDI